MQLKERCINIPTKSKNTLMKKIFLIAMAIITLTLSAQAQAYRDSRYYNNSTGRLEYTYHHHDGVIGTGDVYYGLRLGPAFSTVNSDDKALDGGDSQTGLNLGAVIGFGLSDTTPLFLETGLFYVEKGGKNVFEGKKMTYDLNYLQVPIVAKYVIDIDGDFSVQPFFGGYLACGVGGKIKNYGDRQSESSFSHSISSASTVVCASVAVPHTTCSTLIWAMTSDSPTSLTTSSTHHTIDAGHSA